jgi:Xaa-Pro aminopeptidase
MGEWNMDAVPKEEIEPRIKRFQSVLSDQGLDGAFILQNVDLYYFAGTIQTAILFIPAEGEPILMVQKGTQRARSESPLNAVVSINHRGEIRKVLDQSGIREPNRAGLEMDVLPTAFYLWFKEMFPGCRWVDLSKPLRKLRMVKTPYEVKQIREAAAILHRGYTEIGQIIREGMTELEIDGHLSLIARREGHMGILRMRGWNQEMTYAHVLSGESGATISFLNSPHGGHGNTPAMAQGASFRKVRKNEPIGIDYGVAVKGYVADQFRTFVIGELPKDLHEAHDLSLQIHHRFMASAKPGMPWSDLYRLALEDASKGGYGETFMGFGEGRVKFVGHGLGLEIDELPLIAPGFAEQLAEGMVIALEPKFVFPGRGVVGLEDDYLVTASGVERLTLTEQVLMKLAG